MNKIILIAVSLLAFFSSCSVDNEIVNERDINSNIERNISENSIVDLAIASNELTGSYKDVNGLGQPVSVMMNKVESMALSTAFLNQFSLNTSGFGSLSESTLNKIIAVDTSLLIEHGYSMAFRNQVNDMLLLGRGDLNLFTELIDLNDQLSTSEKIILKDALNFSAISSDHGVDDEWRKRKIMGYLVTQGISDLNVVIATTVLNIAMEQ